MVISPYPGERAKQYVEYLGRSGELPERDSVLPALFETIRDHMDEIEAGTYASILRLEALNVNHWLCMFGSEEIIEVILKHKRVEQTMIANLLQNPNLKSEHLDRLLDLTDKSNRGIMNVRIIHDKQ